ncbi:MAG TPA: hypothetical protein VGF01_03730 [Terracidiphilus sp.]
MAILFIQRDNRNYKNQKHFSLNRFLVKMKAMAIEIAATLVFLNWLIRILIHELWK